ncbi:hypothetical protein HPG69_001421, partial [Diceros bicornis minor]
CQKIDNKLDVFRRELVDVQDVFLFWSIAEKWSQVESFETQPDDLLVSTYPKSGTTWISEILDLIYNNENVEKCKWNAIYKRVPFMELIIPGFTNGVEELKNMWSPRLVKTHLCVQLLSCSFWKNNYKMVYVARNAKDVAVSYYYFYQAAKMHPEPGTWGEFLDKFSTGKCGSDSYFNHARLLVPGISGDWENQFTVAQYERFEKDYEKKMKGSTLQFRSEI